MSAVKRENKSGSSGPQGKARQSNDEPYLVIISNVENDMSKIHPAYLPSFLGLKEPSTSTEGESGCVYQLKCRTETRSAELTVMGPADSDVSTIFAAKKPHHTATPSEPAEAEECKEGGEHAPAEVVEDTAIRYGPLEEKVAKVQHQTYLQHHHLRLDVNIPGREAGSILHPGLRKRPREESKPASTEASSSSAVKQSPYLQKQLATAVAEVSCSWSTKELKEHLKDLPGFLCGWYLYPRHFRVLFSSAEALFNAKKLLDEFEMEGNTRVILQLSDALMRGFNEQLASENRDMDAVF